MNFLHTFLPNSIALQVGGLQIHWYGLLLGLGLVVGIGMLHILLQKYQKDPEEKYTVIYYIVIPAVIGARIYYVLYAWEFYRNNIIDVFKFWEGGLAIHGVIIGGLLGLWWYTRKQKESFLWWADLLVPCLAIGQAIGRWGNYFNQELYGKPTDLLWGIPIEHPVIGYESFTHFHPTFLYESFLNFDLFIVLFVLHILKMQKGWGNGYILGVYVMGYSIIRFLMEFLRLDYSPIVFGMRWAQMLSVLLCVGAIIFILHLRYKNKKTALTAD